MELMASFFGFIKWTIWTTVKIFLFGFLLIFLSATIPFYDVDPVSFNISFPEFKGPLSGNRILSLSEHLYEGQLSGPESVAVWKNDLYTGLSNGEIVRIRAGKISHVAHVRPTPVQCAGPHEMEKCGRPLGMKFDSKGTLYVIEPYRGLLSVDVESGDVKVLMESSKKIDGRAPLFLDDLAIDEDNKTGEVTFYMSDASARWPLKHCFLSVIEHDLTGRIIKFESSSRKASTVVDGLGFPNGVEITDDKSAILFAEVNTRQLSKHYIRGPNAGKTELFSTNLPGEPDNIRRSADKSRETYWVALAYAHHTTSLGDMLSDKPAIRRGILRFNYAVAKTVGYIANLINSEFLLGFSEQVESGEFLVTFVPLYGMVLEVDSKGNIIQSLHSPDCKTTLISEVREVVEGTRRTLYLGSVINKYLGKLVLD